jgi:outer membrane lipoprotein carrier protein
VSQRAQPAPGPSGDKPPAEAFARSVQQHYDAVHDFSADFTHAYEGGALKRQTTERGTVLVKKPGRMRWDYTAPEKKLFVSDGRKIYFYVPADKQVTVSSMPSEDKASTPILFLAGKGNLARDFAVSYIESFAGPPDSVALKLVPKAKTPEFDSLVLVVDRRTLALRMLVAHDAQAGTSTFTFSNLKENVGLSDNQFTFSIPRGADVITQG